MAPKFPVWAAAFLSALSSRCDSSASGKDPLHRGKRDSVEDGDADKGRSESMQGAETVKKAERFPSGADLRMNIGHAAYPVPTRSMAH